MDFSKPWSPAGPQLEAPRYNLSGFRSCRQGHSSAGVVHGSILQWFGGRLHVYPRQRGSRSHIVEVRLVCPQEVAMWPLLRSVF